MERKNQWYLLCCVLVFALCFGSVSIAAGTAGSKTITVNYNDIKLIVDEKQVTPRDSNGQVIEPFIYNGTTYLPVRAVGEALGKDVNWDANTKTVVIGKYDKPESLYPDVKLEKLDYLNENAYTANNGTIKDNFGNSYNGWIRVSSSLFKEAFVEYALDCKYSKLSGRLILMYDYRSQSREVVYRIIVDGKTVKTFNSIQPSENPIDFEIDLKNANILRIEATAAPNGNHGNNVFVDMGLYQ